MKLCYLNDTGKQQVIHPASGLDKQYLEPAESITIDIPEGAVGFVKVWHSSVLLTYYYEEGDR